MRTIDPVPVRGPVATRLVGWIRAAWPVKRRTPATESSSPGVLEEVIEDLRNLNLQTENDFLAIGGKLMEFLRTAEGISSGLNSVTVLISGEHGRHASEVLAGALERCRTMETRAVERGRDLGSLRDGVRAVHGTFSGFRDFLATFRVLCTLTRIETARLGGAGTDFGSLTEDVKSLAESMGCKVENVLDAAFRLGQRVDHTVANLEDINVLLKDLPRVITGVMGSLNSFSSQQAAAVELSARLVSDSDSASASIRDAVTSIQFHDITRQQVEHVIEVLLQNGRQTGCGAILRLQGSQLADAEEKFVSSAARLSRDLDNIAACVREMARNGSSLQSASGDDQNSFFLEMEQCLTAILNAAESYGQAEIATESAARELGATLESMRNAAAEIRDIDLQLHRVALNACLQAAHIGSAGETLTVLAGALQDLAIRSRERSGIVGQALDSMGPAVERLSETDGLAGAGTREDALVGEVRTTIEEMHSWMEASFSRIMEVTTLASGLCDDIADAQKGFVADRLFTEVSGRCRAGLTQLALEAGSANQDATDQGAAHLEELAQRYTMQAEREVHAMATGRCDTQPPQMETVVSCEGRGQAGELGENVELF